MENELDFILINPPSPPGMVSNKDMMGGFGQLYEIGEGKSDTKIPSIDLAYICSQAKKNGLKFFVIDGLIEEISFEKIISRIRERVPKYIFIRTSTPSFSWDTLLIKKIFEELNIPIFIFGPHVQRKREDCFLHKGVFGIITSEPEQTIVDILKNGLINTDGIWFRSNQRIIKNKDRPLIKDLDKLGFPSWEFFPYLDYSLGEQIRYNTPFITVLTSRGCPYQCMYCPYPIGQGSVWRARSAENVIDELIYLNKFLKIKGILFRDAVFTLDKDRTKKICEGILKNKLDFSWRCETRIDCLDSELIKLMNRAGCIGINIGMESFSENVLNFLKTRPVKKDEIIKITKTCNDLGMDTFLFFIIGLPKETKESLLKTIHFVRKLNPTYIQFTIATPYPDTGLEKWAKENKYIINKNTSKITGYLCVMRNEHLGPRTILKLYKYANLSSQLGIKNIFSRIKRRGLFQIIKEIAKVFLSIFFYINLKLTNSEK